MIPMTRLAMKILNGFVFYVDWLWYDAWAFYPFIFVRKNLRSERSIINHERIHIRQQIDIHVAISIPIIIVSLLLEVFAKINLVCFLCFVPFIPTLFYAFDVLCTMTYLRQKYGSWCLPFGYVRANTSFEKEAIWNAEDEKYLRHRKFWAVISYTKKITLTGDSTQDAYSELFNLPKGSVFKIASDYETVMRRIEEYTPQNVVFEVFPINPGTVLYTMYGPDHNIVTKNDKTED